MIVLQHNHPRLRRSNAGVTYEHKPDHTLDPPTVYSSCYSPLRMIRDVKAERESRHTFTCTERPIYGSSRVGMDVTKVVYTTETEALPEGEAVRLLGNKQYEVSNHLGNVLVVVSDVKVVVQEGGTITGYQAQIISATDYSPFGVALEGRTYSGEGYRYGFNGIEKDEEIYSDCFFSENRVLDSRLARWFTIDPLYEVNCWQSPYTAMDNCPIRFDDPSGLNTIYDETRQTIDDLEDGCLDVTLSSKGLDLFLTNNGYVFQSQGQWSNLKGSIYEAAFHAAYPTVRHSQYPVTTTEGNAIVDFVDVVSSNEYVWEGATLIYAHLTFSSDYYEVNAYENKIRLTRQLKREIAACANETTTGPAVSVPGGGTTQGPVCKAADYDMANFTLVILYENYNGDITGRVSRGVINYAKEHNVNLNVIGGTYDKCDNKLGFQYKTVLHDAKPVISGVSNKTVENRHSYYNNYSLIDIMNFYLGITNDSPDEISENDGITD